VTEEPDWEHDTVPTPRVRVEPPPAVPRRPGSDTLEMPAVPASPASRKAPTPPTSKARTSRAPRRQGPARGPGRQRRRPWRFVALLLALVAAGSVGVLAGRFVSTGMPAATVASGEGNGESGGSVDASWTSVDPTGGTGFRQADASTWRTQSYRSAKFGNLKPGVGLVADLGAKSELSAVTVDVAPDGVVLELRAGDASSSDPADFKVVKKATAATGPTTLDASDGGEHRYWLLWVTQLGPREGGYVAELSNPQVES